MLLLTSEITRIIATIVILYTLKIPIFYKILLIMLLDKLDCSHMSYPYTGPMFSKDTSICKTLKYQKYDKIADTICYALILIYILEYDCTNKHLLIALFMYRLLGTCLFLNTDDKKYLIYFPNFFLETSLALMALKNFPGIKPFKQQIFIIVFAFKILQENYLHGSPGKMLSNSSSST